VEASPQVVPPGSRQALTYGENTLGEIADSDPVRLPDLTTLFDRRAERLRALADGHELAPFLRLIAAIAAAQQTALAGLPPGTLPSGHEVLKARRAGQAPLDPSIWQRDESWRAALVRILEIIDPAVLPEPARHARSALSGASGEDLEALADRYLAGELLPRDAAASVFVAAALQVAWTRMAALLEPGDLRSEKPETGDCPVCGSPPVAGVVSPGGTKFGHRHLHCSLCATSWRYVRVRCVHCGTTDKVSYRQLAGTSSLRAECCESCRGYSKVFFIEAMRPLEPFADDLGSLALDLLVGEEGFSRVANPFMLAPDKEES
jgi:FdhE protein